MEVICEKNPSMCDPPMEDPMCNLFEDNNVVLKTVLLDFSEYDVIWFASKISGDTVTLGAEKIEIRN